MLAVGWMQRDNALHHTGQVTTSHVSPAVLCKRKLQSFLLHFLRQNPETVIA